MLDLVTFDSTSFLFDKKLWDKNVKVFGFNYSFETVRFWNSTEIWQIFAFATQNLLPKCEISRSSFFFSFIDTSSSLLKKMCLKARNRLEILPAINFWQQKNQQTQTPSTPTKFWNVIHKNRLIFFFCKKSVLFATYLVFYFVFSKVPFPRYCVVFGNFFQKWDCRFLKYFRQRLFESVIVVNFIYRWRRGPGPMQALMWWRNFASILLGDFSKNGHTGGRGLFQERGKAEMHAIRLVLFTILAKPHPKKVPFLLCDRTKTVC